MEAAAAPPIIALRDRQHSRRLSVPTPSSYMKVNDANRVHVQPASPEVISSLITSLSSISTQPSDLFDPVDQMSSRTASSLGRHASLTAIDQYAYTNGVNGVNGINGINGVNGVHKGGSFGVDYGAFNQPSIEDVQDEGPLDELAASPPVIRTAKPPSGFSSLTAPKSPTKDVNLKTFLRASSRPSSKGSGHSKDHEEVGSIGNLSIEAGAAVPTELRRMSSSDSWVKKQDRNTKGLMYMSSKEKLRETERRRASVTPVGGSKSLSLDRLPPLQFDTDSFLAERPISEETHGDQQESMSSKMSNGTATSPMIGPASPSLSNGSQGGLASPRNIPTRDSSLRKTSSTPGKKRASHRMSRQNGRPREEDGGEVITEVDEQDVPHQEPPNEKKRPEALVLRADSSSKLQQPLRSPSPEPSQGASVAKRNSDTSKVEQRVDTQDFDEGAPSPAIAQRKPRTSSDYFDNMPNGRSKRSGRNTPEYVERKPSKKDSKLKRLSTPLSPTGTMKESHQRSTSQPLSRREVVSLESKPHVTLDDRTSSADSIDDAVESYLCSHRLSQKIHHPLTGRTISFSEVGDPEGYAVFCCVGMGLTRYITAFYDELALTLKLRLITPDRPGVGDSEAYTDGTATPLSWPDDVYSICQALKITKFSILAHSAGAIYALATALRMPQHIRGRIHLLAPWIPPSQLNVAGAQRVSPPTNSIPTSQRILRALPTPILKAANSSFMSATSTSITSSLPKSPRRGKRRSPNGRETPLSGRNTVTPGIDKENQGPNSSVYPKPSNARSFDRALNDPSDSNSEATAKAAEANVQVDKERQTTYDTRLTHAIWELATTGANPAVDLLVCLERRHTIGFRYVDITRAVVIHHGSKDTRVPVENVKWLGKMMRRCEVRILEGEGHGLMASAGVMGGVLTEIAREWEDWMRVVQQKPTDTAKPRTLRERASLGAFR